MPRKPGLFLVRHGVHGPVLVSDDGSRYSGPYLAAEGRSHFSHTHKKGTSLFARSLFSMLHTTSRRPRPEIAGTGRGEEAGAG
jgi:hypothetical protein